MQVLIQQATTRALALASLYLFRSLLLQFEADKSLSSKQVQDLLKDAANGLNEAPRTESDLHSPSAGDVVEGIREEHERLRL